MRQHGDTGGEIVLGPFEVAVDPARLADFAAATAAGGDVPATFPAVWLSDPAVKDALRRAVGPGRLPVHESQSFDYSGPLAPGALVTAPNDFQFWGLQKGCEVEPGPGEEALQEAGSVLHPPHLGLGQRGQPADVVFDQVSQGSFQN